MTNPTANYDKNKKPIMPAPKESVAFGKKTYQQGDMNLAPITKVVPSLSAFDMPTNGVKNSDSARLQQASKLPGRVSDGDANSKL